VQKLDPIEIIRKTDVLTYAMHAALDPFSFVVVSLAGWMNRKR
jgi:hypothetical protein